MSCPQCEEHRNASYETAIALEEAEARAHTLQIKLRSATEALVWCMAKLDPPAWVKTSLEEAET